MTNPDNVSDTSVAGYGSSVDAHAANASIGQAPAGLSDAGAVGNDYIATEPDLGQVNSAMNASAAFHTGMLDHARTMIGQQAQSIPVKGPGVTYSPDQMNVGQYTLAQEHDAIVKKVVGKTLDRASAQWQNGEAAPGDLAASDQTQPNNSELYTSWLQKPDQDLWTDPLGAIQTQGAGQQDADALWHNTDAGSGGTGDPGDHGTQRFMGLVY